jgi:hypothetical protein
VSEGGVTIERWLRRNARHDVPEVGIVLGILALTEHDGRPYVALGTFEEATGVRDTAQLTVGEQTHVGSVAVRVEEINLDERAAVRVSIHQRPNARQAGATRVRVLLVVTAALLVVLLAAWGFATWRNAQTPPPMSAAAVSAGAVRLTGTSSSLPPLSADVDVPGAGLARLSLGPVWTENGVVVAQIAVTPPEGDYRMVDLRLNDPVQVGSVTVRLVAVYDMPNDSHDAADVVVTATD